MLEEASGGMYTTRYIWSPAYVNAMIARDTDTSGTGLTATGTSYQRLWPRHDANWNVTGLVNDSGVVVERYVYDPYGVVTVLDASYGSRSASSYGWLYGFQGMRFDSTTGLNLSLSREYDPETGTWRSADPTGLGPDVNDYRFVGNGPTEMVDPSGLEPPAGGIGPTSVNNPYGAQLLGSLAGGDAAALAGTQVVPYVGPAVSAIPAASLGYNVGTGVVIVGAPVVLLGIPIGQATGVLPESGTLPAYYPPQTPPLVGPGGLIVPSTPPLAGSTGFIPGSTPPLTGAGPFCPPGSPYYYGAGSYAKIPGILYDTPHEFFGGTQLEYWATQFGKIGGGNTPLNAGWLNEVLVLSVAAMTLEEWEEEVRALQDEMDSLQDKIDSIWGSVNGYGKNRPTGSEQGLLKDLVQRMKDLMGKKPKP